MTFVFNHRLTCRLIGMLLVIMALCMLLPIAVSLYYRDGAQFGLAISAASILLIGLVFRNIFGRKASFELRSRESYWITSVVWIVIPLAGTLPYLFTGTFANFTDAAFESFSGFTTTGSSLLPFPEEIPEGVLVWRAMSQWVGGLGLILFVVALLRHFTNGSQQLYEAEFSGTMQRKLHPRLSKSVDRMWRMYSLITLLLVGALLFCGNGLLDSFCVALSVVSTGGFAFRHDGMTSFDDQTLIVVTVFMFLSGINMALLYLFFTLKWRKMRQGDEFRAYLIIFFVAVAVCVAAFWISGNDPKVSLCYSLFHVASTLSTCGFYLHRPDHWPFVVSMVTLIIIFVGASSGSTGGGIKIKRILILWRYVRNYFTRMIHPNAVFCVKVDDIVIDDEYNNKIFAFVFLYIVFALGGAFVLMLSGCTLPESVCMAAANIGNLGPSPLINNLGASLDYVMLPDLAKWVLMFLMLAGRVEIFALMALFQRLAR